MEIAKEKKVVAILVTRKNNEAAANIVLLQCWLTNRLCTTSILFYISASVKLTDKECHH
jgi:hypothetical protein